MRRKATVCSSFLAAITCQTGRIGARFSRLTCVKNGLLRFSFPRPQLQPRNRVPTAEAGAAHHPSRQPGPAPCIALPSLGNLPHPFGDPLRRNPNNKTNICWSDEVRGIPESASLSHHPLSPVGLVRQVHNSRPVQSSREKTHEMDPSRRLRRNHHGPLAAWPSGNYILDWNSLIEEGAGDQAGDQEGAERSATRRTTAKTISAAVIRTAHREPRPKIPLPTPRIENAALMLSLR